MDASHDQKLEIVYEGKYVTYFKKGSWEFVERSNCTGIVIVLAVNQKDQVILTEQFRVPVNKSVIEFPAGLISDLGEEESPVKAAERELVEETGYEAKDFEIITQGPVSAGLTTGIVTIVMAGGVKKVGDGGGDHSESIKVHEIPRSEVEDWLLLKQKEGLLVDPKVYAGLYFLNKSKRTKIT